jgi:hypothetical protein
MTLGVGLDEWDWMSPTTTKVVHTQFTSGKIEHCVYENRVGLRDYKEGTDKGVGILEDIK